MIKYKLLDLLLTFSHCEIRLPFNQEYKKKIDIKKFVDCNISENGKIIFSNHQVELTIMDSLSGNKLLDIKISYVAVYKVEKIVKQEKVIDYLKTKTIDLSIPYISRDINEYLTKSGYPPLHFDNFINSQI